MWSGPKGSSVEDRITRQNDAKKALLERFKSAPKPGDTAYEEQQAKLKDIAEALRAKQKAEEEARRIREAKQKAEREAEEARKAAEEAKRLAEEEAARKMKEKSEADAAHLLLLAEQKAARDARYAARKAAQGGKKGKR
jgi:predicted ribosome quality control (RQC) complex YloA/Tae2 family protein